MRKLENRLKNAGERSHVIDAEIFFTGMLSVLDSEKLHKFLSGAMVLFTTVSLLSIAEGKLHQIDFPYSFVLPLGLVGLLVYAFFFSDFAEKGKISLIRTALFSTGWNQFFGGVGSIFVIVALIMINYFGVLATADFSKRYLDKKLLESETVVLQKNNINLLSKSIGQGDFSLFDNQISDLRNQKRDIKKSLDIFVASKNKRKYATLIRRETAKTNKSLAVIDWKISKLLAEKTAAQKEQNQHNQSIISKSINASNALTNDIKIGKEVNQNLVNNETNWAKYIAIGGEVLDGFFILLYLVLHRTNPSAEYVPSLKKGARKEYINVSENTESIESKHPQERFILAENSLINRSVQKKAISRRGKVSLSDVKYQEIKEIADRYQEDEKHISQRELIKRFNDVGKSLNPAQATLYFSKRKRTGEIYRPSKNGRYEYSLSEKIA